MLLYFLFFPQTAKGGCGPPRLTRDLSSSLSFPLRGGKTAILPSVAAGPAPFPPLFFNPGACRDLGSFGARFFSSFPFLADNRGKEGKAYNSVFSFFSIIIRRAVRVLLLPSPPFFSSKDRRRGG